MTEELRAIALMMYADAEHMERVTATLHALAVGLESTTDYVDYLSPVAIDPDDEMLLEAIMYHGLGRDEDEDRIDPGIVARRMLREQARGLVSGVREEEKRLEAERRAERQRRNVEFAENVVRLLTQDEQPAE